VRAPIPAAGPPRRSGLTIELGFDSLEAACGNLIGLGASVEVLEPLEVRSALRAQAEEVARLYARSARRGKR
jgi:predicted DNA-binding transcriptional regulator YafY